MAPLAALSARAGWNVDGCDATDSLVLGALRELGVIARTGHARDHAIGRDLVVATSAAAPDVPCLVEARARGVAIAKRAEVVGAWSRQRTAICIAGTAGKTTTTAMAAWILLRAGHDPSALIGGEVPGLGVGGRAGASRYLVVEADEFDRSFLHLAPAIAVVTNVEADHLDYYGSVEAMEEAFRAFAASTPREGLIVNGDDPGAARLADRTSTIFGTGPDADWQIGRIDAAGPTTTAVLRHAGVSHLLTLPLPGRHNVHNAVGAIAAAARVGVDAGVSVEALREFPGVGRRFERRGDARGVVVYDDYAHHPMKVRAALATARQVASGRVICIFQPHTYHRTAALFEDFRAAFDDADVVLMLAPYSPAGREDATPEGDAARLVRAIGRAAVIYCPDATEAVGRAASTARPGDIIMTVGAGDVTRLASRVVAALEAT
jgi:UDP-N-acetylmuramate--alanine ligase